MSKPFDFQNLANNLPDAYKKDVTSNNFKILEIERYECQDLRETLNEIMQALDIENASGKTLDLYGQSVGQARGKATDAQYIIMIKARAYRNLSNGTYKSIIDNLAFAFSCSPSQVLIVEDEIPCSVTLVSLPLDAIIKAGLTTGQTTQIIKSLLPVGVTLSSYTYEGTFEFAASENESDTSKGFSNSENDMTIGGYFGIIQGDDENVILPI